MITLFNIRPKGFNIGNDAIHVALRNLIYQAFGRVVNIIEVPATAKYESQSLGGLNARTVNDINRFGDGVIVGGGNLFENNELTVDHEALRALHVPLMLFSLSRGKVYNRNLELCDRTDAMPDSKVAALHDKAHSSLARDTRTREHIATIGCKPAQLGGCPTLFLSDASTPIANLPQAEVPGALISIRTPSLMNVPLRLQARVQSDIAEMITLLRDAGHKRIRILCNDSRDIEFASLFQSSNDIDFVYTSDVYWYLALLRAASVVISYRLHATVPCLSFRTPVINISYDERAISLLRDYGLEAWDINMVEQSNLLGAVTDRLANMQRLKEVADNNLGLWSQYKEIQRSAMSSFADTVKDYARSTNSKLKRSL